MKMILHSWEDLFLGLPQMSCEVKIIVLPIFMEIIVKFSVHLVIFNYG